MTVHKACVVLGLPLFALLLLKGSDRMLGLSWDGGPSVVQDASWGAGSTLVPSTSPRRKISLVVELRGEMANLLSRLVFAKGIKLWVEEHYNGTLQVELVGKPRGGGAVAKWNQAISDLKRCFPNLGQQQSTLFQGEPDADWILRKQQMESWMAIIQADHQQQQSTGNKIMIDRGDSDCGRRELFCLHEQLAFLQTLLQQEIPATILLGNTTERSNLYTLPFLMTNQMASFDVIVDQYYHQIKEWLHFDKDECCSSWHPHPDEVVFHLRNFRAEMKERNYFARGYEELSPTQLSMELLGHLKAGSKIAIASRGNAYVDLYVKALEERQLQVRTTPQNNSGVQDFCFLLEAQQELVGTLRSTYTRWAALLGQAKKVQLYSIDSPSTRKAHGNDNNFVKTLHYQWKQPELRAKIQYRIFSSNETRRW